MAGAHVAVRREGDDLVVHWDGRGALEIAVSRSPDVLDEVEADIRLTGPGEAVIRGLDPSWRHYLHLTTGGSDGWVLAERLLPLCGAKNFRDLGGYPTASGRPVRWGRVYRSDTLSQLTASDLAYLDHIGVRIVVDYRGPHEIELAPSRVTAAHIKVVNLAVGDGSQERRLITDRIADGDLTEITVADMTAYYLLTLEGHAAEFGEVLRRAADPAQHALVFHCTAGKDRTGLAAALLLAALEVDEATILDDYELSNGYRAERRALIMRELRDRGVVPERFTPFFTASRDVLAGALAGLRERYGSIETYLEERAGVDADVIEALRASLLGGPDR
jgi:protein-tyrosine phosphatase